MIWGLKDSLKGGWKGLIKRYEPYEWFATLTFRDEIHPEQANKHYMRFIRIMNEDRFGKRYREKGLGTYYFRTTEYQTRGAIHFHCLMGGGLDDLSISTYTAIWRVYYGLAKIEPYVPSMGAAAYLSKSVEKGGEIDFFIPRKLRIYK